MTSAGSTPFPADFDIFLPSASIVNPQCMTDLYGGTP